MIHKNINRRYFREERLEEFFEKCFQLPKQNALELKNNTKFMEFCYDDLKTIF